jgi:hypothetical protein
MGKRPRSPGRALRSDGPHGDAADRDDASASTKICPCCGGRMRLVEIFARAPSLLAPTGAANLASLRFVQPQFDANPPVFSAYAVPPIRCSDHSPRFNRSANPHRSALSGQSLTTRGLLPWKVSDAGPPTRIHAAQGLASETLQRSGRRLDSRSPRLSFPPLWAGASRRQITIPELNALGPGLCACVATSLADQGKTTGVPESVSALFVAARPDETGCVPKAPALRAAHCPSLGKAA